MISTHKENDREPRSSREEKPTLRSSLDWARDAGIANDVIREMGIRVQQKREARRRRIVVVGSMVGLLMVLGAWWQLREPAVVSPAMASEATVTIPTRRQLADGSVVELKLSARIAVDFSPTRRRVVLEEGEAHFQVSKHDPRPFIVVAGGVEARAIGTAFLVQLRRTAVEVLVTEGRVAVDKATASVTEGHTAAPQGLATTLETIAMLDAGKSIVVEVATLPTGTTTGVIEVTAAEMADRLSWRVPRLEFSRVPLSQVIAVFNQHSRSHLVLADPQLGQMKLSGMVRADNTDTLLQLLRSELGLTDERRGEREILLRHDPAAGKNN